jgi:hypothetical protein
MGDVESKSGAPMNAGEDVSAKTGQGAPSKRNHGVVAGAQIELRETFSGARRRIRRFPVRAIHFTGMLDTFLVCAILTILVIRTQLWLTNYPQLGGGGLHIAHLLWGGLGMMIAIFILVTFLSPAARQVGAVIGGIGFGFFIDELGKFVTSDNNYFFRPTAAIIYVIFILLWLGIRQLERRGRFTPREYLVNAIELLKEAAMRDLDERDKQDALEFLDKADQKDPLVGQLRDLINNVEHVRTREPGWVSRIGSKLRAFYERVIDQRWFSRAVATVFIIWAGVAVLQILALAVAAGLTLTGDLEGFDFTDGHYPLFIEIARIVSSIVSAVFVWLGVLRLRSSRLRAYRAFERALLINIFLTQVFAFVESQFSAVFGLIISLILYMIVRSMITRERELVARAEAGKAAADPGDQSGTSGDAQAPDTTPATQAG